MTSPNPSQPPVTLASPGAEATGETRWRQDRITAAVSGLLREAGAGSGEIVDLRRAISDWLADQFDATAATLLKKFGHELWRVRHLEIPALVAGFIPPKLRTDRLSVKKQPKEEWVDPVLVLSQALKTQDPLTRFETCRDLSLAFLFQWLIEDAERFGLANLKEQKAVEKNGVRGPRRLLLVLKKRGVVRSHERPITLITQHDEANARRCVGIRFDDGRVFLEGEGTPGPRIMKPVDLVTLDTDPPIQALLTVRRKTPLQTVAKMLLVGADNPLAVADRRGVRFAFRNRAEFEKGSSFISERVGNGYSTKRHLATSDAPINPHAAAGLLLSKDSMKYSDFWALEIQYLLARQHVDLVISLGAENTSLYRRRQYTDPRGLFTQVLRKEFYGIDWLDPEVQDAMDEHIRARLSL